MKHAVKLHFARKMMAPFELSTKDGKVSPFQSEQYLLRKKARKDRVMKQYLAGKKK